MATEKYPQQNVHMPMDPDAVQAIRDRLAPPGGSFLPDTSGAGAVAADGKGSRREIRPGEWVDDRKITIGGPSSPSKDSPPEIVPRPEQTATYDPIKAYAVVLAKAVPYAGRMLSPAKAYTMMGSVCTELSAAILTASEITGAPTPSE